MPQHLGVADDLRCAAMEIQEDYPHLTRQEFLDAAVAEGYARATASRCWSYVKGK